MFHPTTFYAYWGVIFIVFSVFKENSCHGNHADGKNSQDTFLHTQGPKEQDCICWGKLTSTSHENPHAPALHLNSSLTQMIFQQKSQHVTMH